MRIKRSILNCSVAACIMMVAYFIVNFDWRSANQIPLHVSNAFSIAGMMLLLAAGFGWLQKNHMTDWLGYALYQARFLLLNKKEKSFTNFFDYRAEKEKEYQNLLIWPRFWVGILLLALGLLFGLLLL